MPAFRRLPISRRLWLIVLVAVAMLLAMSVLLLRQSYDDLYAGKVLKTQHVVESVQGILKHQQFELCIQRPERGIPLENIFEVRDQRLVLLEQVGIPVILFKERLSLREDVSGLEYGGILFPCFLEEIL